MTEFGTSTDETRDKEIASGAGIVEIRVGAGELRRVTVITAGAGMLEFYDNDSASATGMALFVVPAGAAAGQVFDVEMPARLGIVASAAAGSPDVTVSYA